MTGQTTVVDSDAHVIESEHTWDFLDPEDACFRPVLVGAESDPRQQYWLVGGKVVGFRPPSRTAEELTQISRAGGREVLTPQAAREMADVDLRLRHMDEIGVDVQILYNTLFIEQVTSYPEADIALCKSWNRWLAGIWKQGRGRLRW